MGTPTDLLPSKRNPSTIFARNLPFERSFCFFPGRKLETCDSRGNVSHYGSKSLPPLNQSFKISIMILWMIVVQHVGGNDWARNSMFLRQIAILPFGVT